MNRPGVRRKLSIPRGFSRPRGSIIFGRENLYENKCSWNHKPEMQKELAGKLMENLMAKRGELVKKACGLHLGKTPTKRDGVKRLNVVKFEGDDARLTWIFLGKKPVAVMTDPVSRIEGKAYVLGFQFLILAGSKN